MWANSNVNKNLIQKSTSGPDGYRQSNPVVRPIRSDINSDYCALCWLAAVIFGPDFLRALAITTFLANNEG